MSNYKFNKGDKAIQLELDYFDNPYHYDKIISEYTVKNSNARYFTVANEDDYNQLSGQCTWQINKLYHKEKEKDIILSKIEKASQKFDEEREKENGDRIEFLQAEIKKCQDEIIEIKSGNVKMKIGLNLYDIKTYKAEVLKKISEKLNYTD